MKIRLAAWLLVAAFGFLIPTPVIPPTRADAAADQAITRESDYIVNCSFTEFARNSAGAQPAADAYGALNVLRIYQKGPDWVRPGEASVGAIGLMAAAIHLHDEGQDITRYDQVLDRFFHTWVAARTQPFDTDPSSIDYGGVYERIYYSSSGKWVSTDRPNAGVTGQLIGAMWKYYEYNMAVDQPQAASDWLQQSWPLVQLAGDFIRRNTDPATGLVRSNAGAVDLWISDSTYAAMAFRCLDAWSQIAARDEVFGYTALADAITVGLQGLKDNGARTNFFRYRDGRSAAHAPTYGDRIDQLCFLPYEADVLDPGEAFAGSISDWWTQGSNGICMTYQTANTSDWRYFGTHLRYFFAGGKESQYLFPGAALELAKVEWKHANRTGDSVTMERAQKRFEWVRSTAQSGLWLGASGAAEANVPNGIVDWRDTMNYGNTAGSWARFVDTSGNFIEVALMLSYGIDTQYTPN